FARWHRDGDLALAASGVPSIVLRPNGFMQNVLCQQVGAIRERNCFFTSTPGARVSLIDAADVAAAAAAALTRDDVAPGPRDLTGPAAITPEEMAFVMSAILGRGI